jgi:tetratricopeptide (TPR) repeat protein
MILRTLASLAIAIAAALAPATAEELSRAKDVGPAGACDTHAKGSAEWSRCVGLARAAMPDNELFYAGYWLARSGRYAEALSYLTLARQKDERVLTYIGFATRKLGDVEAAMPYYAAALRANPDYVVARAYLGEAHLARNAPDKARAELAEIETRCGRACAPYASLAAEIAAFETAKKG